MLLSGELGIEAYKLHFCKLNRCLKIQLLAVHVERSVSSYLAAVFRQTLLSIIREAGE